MAPFIGGDALDELINSELKDEKILHGFVSIVLSQYETITTPFFNILIQRHGTFSALLAVKE
jgi:hypothetical protein